LIQRFSSSVGDFEVDPDRLERESSSSGLDLFLETSRPLASVKDVEHYVARCW
jgi:hypothetical protein